MTEQTSKSPSHRVYAVAPANGEKARWTEIGAA